MNKFYLFIGFFGLLIIISCSNQRINTTQNFDQKELSKLAQMMTGTFSSEDQAKEDSSFYNINLVMFPIWEDDKSAKWLYVEQAATNTIDKPYRQRVYKLTINQNHIFESSIFELAHPDKFIHAWTRPDIFKQINPDSLTPRQGCAVILKKANGCYSGSTKDKDCKSTLRGAAYATSQVNVCPDQIISWDQGWDNNDQQVWGAEVKGYIFKRKL